MFWIFFTTLYHTKSSQSGVRIRCERNLTKSHYFSRLGESLNEPSIIPKKYWSILHSLLHTRKITKSPPIRHNNTLFWYLGKTEYLQLFFWKAMFLNWDRRCVTCGLSTTPPSLRISKSRSSKNTFYYSGFWC